MYYVYVIKSKKYGNIYIGYSTNLKQRIIDHNAGKSTYTNKYKPWVLLSYFAFSDKNVALDFERYLKTASGKAFMRKRLISV